GSSSSGSRTVSSALSTASVRAADPAITGAVMLASSLLDQLGVLPGGRGAGLGGQLVLVRHLEVVEPGRVQAEDLLLARDTQPRVVGELLAVRHLPFDEALDLTLRLPD